MAKKGKGQNMRSPSAKGQKMRTIKNKKEQRARHSLANPNDTVSLKNARRWI